MVECCPPPSMTTKLPYREKLATKPPGSLGERRRERRPMDHSDYIGEAANGLGEVPCWCQQRFCARLAHDAKRRRQYSDQSGQYSSQTLVSCRQAQCAGNWQIIGPQWAKKLLQVTGSERKNVQRDQSMIAKHVKYYNVLETAQTNQNWLGTGWCVGDSNGGRGGFWG